MTSEVSDCTTSSFESEKVLFEPISHVPKGFHAIPDSIQFTPPKPTFAERFVMSTGLFLVHMITGTVQFCNWVLKTFFGYASRQKVLYKQLHYIAKNGDPGQIKGFLMKHSEDESAAGFLFGEFLAIPELYFHLPEILNGANVCLVQDGGFFCTRWREHPDSTQRISSHAYQNDDCYAIGHFLFWIDPYGNTRFQFEKSPFRGFFSTINHMIDYLRYRRDNEQQGVMGASPFTEHFCLKVAIDPEEFLTRKVNHWEG